MKNLLAIAAVAAALAACGGSEHADIKKWMNDETKNLKGQVGKIDEPKKFSAFRYESDKAIDPFNNAKIALVAESKKGAAAGSGLKPDFDRPKEVLEAFPLENISMVGMMKQKTAFFGIVKAETNLHRVKVGNYMGQSFGIITSITETEITLKELVQDGGGDWIERVSTLQLQEVRK